MQAVSVVVKDLDAAYAVVKSRGAKVALEPIDFGKIAGIMTIEDPDGNWIELPALKHRQGAVAVNSSTDQRPETEPGPKRADLNQATDEP
jgi:hypothetical protein